MPSDLDRIGELQPEKLRPQNFESDIDLLCSRIATFQVNWTHDRVRKKQRKFNITIDSILKYRPKWLPKRRTVGDYIRSANVYKVEEKWKLSIEQLTRAISLVPHDDPLYLQRERAGSLYLQRAKCYSRLSLFAKAIADCNTVIDFDSRNDGAYLHRGTCYFHEGDTGRALSDYTKAIELSPENAVAYFFRGVLHEKNDEDELAFADYSMVIELRPSEAIAYSYRGRLCEKHGKLDRALSDYRKATSLDPSEHNRSNLERLGIRN